MFSLTIFQNQWDNKTHRKMHFKSWDEFRDFLYKLSKLPKKGKRDAELLSPAIYETGTTRANKNVLAWAGWAAVDVDDWQVEGNLEHELRDRFGAYNFICYSTASSVSSMPKFRLVFELNQSVPAERIKHFWFSLNSELEAVGDKQTKDVSRMYYIPADYAGANNFIFSNTGRAVDPDELMAKWPYEERKTSGNFLDRLPDAFRDQVIAYRKDKLDNTDYVWTSYQDCPFWPKRMAAEYITISSEGWYRKMYQIMIGIAGNAVSRGYPITATQIVEMCRQFDMDTGKWYENRPMEVEANNALEYVYINGEVK